MLMNMGDDFRSFHNLLPPSNQKKSMRTDEELVELVWQNGHLEMHSQANRETTTFVNEHKHEVPSRNGGPLANPNSLIQEDEAAPWNQYPLDDPLAKDFCSDFFYGIPTAESAGMDTIAGGRCAEIGFNAETSIFTNPVCKQANRIHVEQNILPSSNSQTIGSIIPQSSCADTSAFVNFSHFSRPAKINAALTYRNSNVKDGIQREVGESSSMVSKLSGNWASNQSQKQPDMGHCLSSSGSDALTKHIDDIQKTFQFQKRGQMETHDANTVASSSGGSGLSVGRTGQQANNQSHKRKGRETEESECHSEDVECQSLEVGKHPQRSTSTRRSRAAEVHNLSERRRRDRINEKMKALQELIPHCNKTDKASMLDEAIEYLKSLQLQVQIMWMGSSMAPMVFPNAQQYLSLMGRGIGQGPMASIPGAQMPRVPMANQSIPLGITTNQTSAVESPITNPVNLPNQMQHANIPDHYTRYLSFHHKQPSSQTMDLFSPYQSQLAQLSQTSTLTGGSEPPHNGTSQPKNIQNGKSG